MKSVEELLIAETTEYDLKEALEIKKPKDWLKTISAFANTAGGTIYFGITDDKDIKGLNNAQYDAEKISELIHARITPLPYFVLSAFKIEGNDILAVKVSAGDTTPYFYQSDGTVTAYIRIGNRSVPADSNRLRELVLKGKNLSFDSLPTEFSKSELTFSFFEAAYKKVTKSDIKPKEYISFGLCNQDGILTNAGLLFADDCPLLQARVFCTHWNGLYKGSVGDDAIDSEEFEGDLVSLLKNSNNFIRLNSKKRWKKMPDHRVNKPDYSNRAVFEALCNALMHRDWSIIGSEVHVDMFDDRLEIFSPGGMPDGTLIQEQNINDIPSIRRNPIIADMFQRLDYVERKGSGIGIIRTETSYLYGYTDVYAPEFRSTHTAFHVILKNVNYNMNGVTPQVNTQDNIQVNTQDDLKEKILLYCKTPRSKTDIVTYCGYKDIRSFTKYYLQPLLDSEEVCMTLPDRPNSRNQKYITTNKP